MLDSYLEASIINWFFIILFMFYLGGIHSAFETSIIEWIENNCVDVLALHICFKVGLESTNNKVCLCH